MTLQYCIFIESYIHRDCSLDGRTMFLLHTNKKQTRECVLDPYSWSDRAQARLLFHKSSISQFTSLFYWFFSERSLMWYVSTVILPPSWSLHKETKLQKHPIVNEWVKCICACLFILVLWRVSRQNTLQSNITEVNWSVLKTVTKLDF